MKEYLEDLSKGDSKNIGNFFMKNKPALQSLGHAVLVFIYVSGVAWALFNND